ncbi:hypothetical protein [Enterobacter kobei]|uniref:hypothetical protein n=1 Tax=Enterobacter kobei TaxID=208224 RepID=UPI00388D5700
MRTTALKKVTLVFQGLCAVDEEKALLRAQAAQAGRKSGTAAKDHESSAKRVEKQLAKLNEPQRQTACTEKEHWRVRKACSLTRKGRKPLS